MVRLARMTSVQAVKPVHAPAGVRSHVLAVDDDPVIREAISDYLGQYDFRVTAVADGRAMQAALEHDVVDLVVLDLKLRDEDGMALASRLREESAIPIIMLTGRREEADRVMGLELAADDYLTKPFRREVTLPINCLETAATQLSHFAHHSHYAGPVTASLPAAARKLRMSPRPSATGCMQVTPVTRLSIPEIDA